MPSGDYLWVLGNERKVARMNKLIKAYDEIPSWNELIRRPLTMEEKEDYANTEWTEMIENLPSFGEDVLVTDGRHIWVDSF